MVLDWRPSFRVLVAVAAVAGFLFGACVTPSWNSGLDSAQVLAGTVRLTPGESSHIYHTSVYSFWLIQLPALLLKAGLPPWVVATLVSGGTTALMFVVVALLVYATSESALLAILAAFAFQHFRYNGGHNYHMNYQIVWPLFGTAGMFAGLLPLGLYLCKRPRAAAFCVGLLPSLHPTLALMGGLLWLGAAKSEFRRREVLLWGMAGFALTMLSIGVQVLFLRHSPPPSDPALAAQITRAFFVYWSMHHSHAIAWREFRVELCLILLGAFVLYRRQQLPWAASRMVVAIAVASSLPLLYGLLYFRVVAPEKVPQVLLMLMPYRWLNSDLLLFPALGLGLLGYCGLQLRQRGALVILTATLALLLVTRLSPAARSGPVDMLGLFTLAMGLLAVAISTPTLRQPASAATENVAGAVLLLSLVLHGALTARSLVSGNFASLRTDRCERLRVAAARRTEPLLVAPGLDPSLLISRLGRGLLLEPNDQLNYGPAGALDMERRSVGLFGASILDANGPRMLLGQAPQALWERRSGAEWARLGAEFQFRDVLVPESWRLDLTRTEACDGLALYSW